MLASLSIFKDGVTQLCTSLETYGESCEKPSTSQALTEDDEPEGAIAMTNKEVNKDAIDTAFDLHKFIKKVFRRPRSSYSQLLTVSKRVAGFTCSASDVYCLAKFKKEIYHPILRQKEIMKEQYTEQDPKRLITLHDYHAWLQSNKYRENPIENV